MARPHGRDGGRYLGNGGMDALDKFVHSKRFQYFIVGVILVNAVVLGLLTLELSPQALAFLTLVDDVCLYVFVVEIALKLLTMRLAFFRDGWNIFDIVVVAIAFLPNSGGLSVLRALRVLRVLRLVTAIPSMRRVINGMFVALPGGASVAGVLFILYYVAAIISLNLFRDVPEHFGDIGTTFFTLFKMMTLEGWPDIATVVIEKHPKAWIFFVCFIIFTTFTTLNLLFGIIVDAMEKSKEEEVREEMAERGMEVEDVPDGVRIAVIEDEIRQIRVLLSELAARPR
jgi:voltage-gated sodium channel